MAAPPNPADGNPQNPAPEAVQPMTNDQQDANKGAAKETSMFVNTEPIRDEQVQNAVKFLSHPKVKGSPVMYRRSFLERKGLTKEEIDEAFRRVPDESPSLSTSQPAVTNQGGQTQPSSNIQSQVSTQSLQPTAAAPVGASSKVGTLTASRFHWSHAILAVGVLAVSGAGTAIVFKNAVVPRLKSWIHKVVSEDEEEGLAKKTNTKQTLAEEAAAAAKAAAAAASDVARASQEMLISKTEEKRYFGELMSLLGVQVQEMKSMSNSIRKLEGQSSISEQLDNRVQVTSPRPSYANGKADYDSRTGQSNISGREDNRVQVTSSRPSYANGKANYDSHSARSLSPPPASVEPSTAPPHPKSYMEIMAMVQRGERPPNIREINDLPPNPDQPVSNPRLAPRPKPWEAAQSLASSTDPHETSNGFNSYIQENGPGTVYQSNGEGSNPWWQQKNVRITEREPQDEKKTGYPGGAPAQRSSWVPPQPPPVAMAESAAAIRQPKKIPFQNEQNLNDEQLLACSSEVTDELQRVTKISESGGASEIQREGGGSYTEV